jgi:hypothetical protein
VAHRVIIAAGLNRTMAIVEDLGFVSADGLRPTVGHRVLSGYLVRQIW